MTLNIFDLLDSWLGDYASARTRRTIHTVILIAATIVTLWFAVDGDWKQFVISLAAALYAGANKANTAANDTEPDDSTVVDPEAPESFALTDQDPSALAGDGAERGTEAGDEYVPDGSV